jgi:hypothetical protein
LIAGVSQSKQTNERAYLGEGDYNTRSTDLGLRFAYASGSAVTYRLKHANGTYLNRVQNPSSAYNDDFNEIDHELNLQWVMSGNSVASMSAAHINRSYPNFDQLSYSGLTTSANFNWRITGKSSLTAGWSRALTSYQTASTSYTQTDRYSVGPSWQLSPKTVLQLSHQLTQTSYLGAPSSVATVQRRDTTRDTSLSVNWQPYPSLNLSASLQNTARASNLEGLDFDSNLTTVAAKFTF